MVIADLRLLDCTPSPGMMKTDLPTIEVGARSAEYCMTQIAREDDVTQDAAR